MTALQDITSFAHIYHRLPLSRIFACTDLVRLHLYSTLPLSSLVRSSTDYFPTLSSFTGTTPTPQQVPKVISHVSRLALSDSVAALQNTSAIHNLPCFALCQNLPRRYRNSTISPAIYIKVLSRRNFEADICARSRQLFSLQTGRHDQRTCMYLTED